LRRLLGVWPGAQGRDGGTILPLVVNVYGRVRSRFGVVLAVTFAVNPRRD